MTPHSLFPAHVKILYHSEYGQHVMTLPTLEWLSSPDTGGSGSFRDWLGGDTDAHTMIEDLVTLFLPFFKPATVFDMYTVYTMADEDAIPMPVASQALALDGTSVQTAWHKAVQTTFTFRTDNFGIAKLVFLDAPSGGLFDRILGFDGSAEALAILAELSDDTKGWSGRDNGKPNALTQIAYTLNEKLRRQYSMN